MLLRCLIGATGLAVVLAVAPVSAQAADHLDCMADGYDAAAQKTIDDAIVSMDMRGKDSEKPSLGDLMSMLSAHAGTCADQHGWTSGAILDAMFYQTGVVMEKGLRRNSPLSAADMLRLDKAAAEADQDRLWPVLENMVAASMFGDGTGKDVSEEDELYVGLVVLSSGIPVTDANNEYAGALLASRAIQRLARKRFETE